LHAKSIATQPTNWSFFLITVCWDRNLSIRLTVRNNVSFIRSNLSCTCWLKNMVIHKHLIQVQHITNLVKLYIHTSISQSIRMALIFSLMSACCII
jgi:hypothetical protein